MTWHHEPTQTRDLIPKSTRSHQEPCISEPNKNSRLPPTSGYVDSEQVREVLALFSSSSHRVMNFLPQFSSCITMKIQIPHTQYFLPNRSPRHAFGKLNVCACDFHYTDSTNSIHPSPLKEWKSDENLDTKPNNPWPIKRLLRWTVIPSCKETDRTLMLFFHLWPLLRTLDPKQHLETKISLDCKLSDPSRIFL